MRSDIPEDIKRSRNTLYLNVDDAGAPYLTTDDIEEIAKSILDERERHASLTAERDRLLEAIIEACDLLMERKQGSPARSPSHNARLCMEQAIGHFNGRPISPEESKP